MIKHCLLLLIFAGGVFAQDSRVTFGPAANPQSPVLVTVADKDPTKPPLVQILASGQVLVRSDLTMDEASRAFWTAAGKTYTSLMPPPAPPVPCPPPPVVEQEKHFCNLPADYAAYLLPTARLCVMRPGI